MLRGPHACGTPLRYDHGIVESIPEAAGWQCTVVQSLTMPSSRVYVRVNTLKADPGMVLDMLRGAGYEFYRDEEIPEALWAPVKGPYRVPVYEKKVVVDKRAAESVMLGSDLYVPGAVEARGVAAGDEVTIVAPNGVPVAAGVAVISWREALERKRRGQGGVFVRVTHPMYRAPRPPSLPGYREGLIYGQSLPSMYVARLLDPRPGEVIVDLTAAPGGKVGHAAQLAGPGATVIAVDRRSKAGRLRENLERLGLHWVRVVAGDSRRITSLLPGLEGRVDKVILDPPCTNLGVIPKVEDHKTVEDARALARYQAQLIRAAARLLRRGGLLSYSVCTLTAWETEAQASYIESLGFQARDPPGWARRPLRTRLGLLFSPARHRLTGFYITVLEKR